MGVDALAKRLAVLLEDGSIQASRLSKRARSRLASLFDAGILRDVHAGAGYRVEVVSRSGLERWIERHFPHGLEGLQDGTSARAAGVANLRDSKRGGTVESTLVMLRGFGSARLPNGRGDALPAAELTTRFGVAALAVDEDSEWRLHGRVCTVENLEVFMHVEHLLDPLDIAVYTHGNLPGRVLDWLEASATSSTEFVHAGDYDPVGLAEFLRLHQRLGDRASLLVPEDLDALFERYGNKDILRRSRSELSTVRTSDHHQVQQVVDLIERYGCALEQEALLIDPDGGMS